MVLTKTQRSESSIEDWEMVAVMEILDIAFLENIREQNATFLWRQSGLMLSVWPQKWAWMSTR